MANFRLKATFGSISGNPVSVQQVKVTAYLKQGALITEADGDIIVPDPVYGSVVDGVLKDESGVDGLPLLAYTGDLTNVGVPLVYSVTFRNGSAGTRRILISPVYVEAGTNTDDVALGTAIPVAETPDTVLMSMAAVVDNMDGDSSSLVPTQRAVKEYVDENGGGGSGTTNLGISRTATGVEITSSTGTDVTIPAADGSNAGVMTQAMQAKLTGITPGATPNSTDAYLLNRGNHTGSQSADTIEDGTINHVFTADDDAKLAALEPLADVTDGANVGAAIHAAANKAAPASGDKYAVIDPAAGNALRTTTFGALSSAIVAMIVAASPGTLDTLNEIAAALNNDPNFSTTMINALATKQPLDDDLTAIAGVSSAANKLLYATGPGAWALTDFTAAARGLLDDADVEAMRGTLQAAAAAITVTGTKSLTGGGALTGNRTLELQGDEESPGVNRYWGTGGAGTKGFFAMPAGSLPTMTGQAGKWLQVNGDSTAAGWQTGPGVPPNMVNVKDAAYGALGDNSTDDTAAIDAAFAVSGSVFFPPGKYLYNGTGLNHASPRIIGAGRSLTEIKLGATSSLINCSAQVDRMDLRDLTITGGACQVKMTYTGSNVTSMFMVERVYFYQYTECAISHDASDMPNWHILNNFFRGLDSLNTIGLALSGLTDQSMIMGNAWILNRFHMKIRRAGNNCYIAFNDLIQFSSANGNGPRGMIWFVPNSNTTNAGNGLIIFANKFGNEGIQPGDFRVLCADEQSGAYNGVRMPELGVDSTGYVLCHQIEANNFNQGGGTAKPSIVYTTTKNMEHCRVGPQVFDSGCPVYVMEYRTPPTDPDPWNSRNVFGPFLGRFGTDTTLPIKVSNAIGVGYMVDDGTSSHQMVDTVRFQPGTDAGYRALSTAATSAFSLSSVTRTADTDAFGGSNASKIQFTASGGVFYNTLSAMTPGQPVWIEFDVKNANDANALSAFHVRIQDSSSFHHWRRSIEIPTVARGWTTYRYTFYPRTAGTTCRIYFSINGDATKVNGTVIVGRVRVYHANGSVPDVDGIAGVTTVGKALARAADAAAARTAIGAAADTGLEFAVVAYTDPDEIDLATNGTLEAAATGWSVITGAGGAATGTRSTSAPHAGTYGYRVNHTTTSTWEGGAQYDVDNVVTGIENRVSVWVRCSAAKNFQVRVLYRDSGAAVIETDSSGNVACAANTWTELSLTTTCAAAGADWATIQILVPDAGIASGTNTDFDDLEFVTYDLGSAPSRPSATTVLWIGGTIQPPAMASGDVWLKETA